MFFHFSRRREISRARKKHRNSQVPFGVGWSVSDFKNICQPLFVYFVLFTGLDYSDAFFARAKFRGGAKNEKYRTATYLFLVKNLGNFTNKTRKI